MRQHTIPESYLQAWCNPAPLPPNHQPFIWIHSKDGKVARKRAPHKAFRESDRYTIRQADGDKVLLVEHGLGTTEDSFVRLRPKIDARGSLGSDQKLALCTFATAMFARSKAQGDHFTAFFQRLHKMVENLEKRRNAEPGLSQETRFHAENGPASTLTMFMVSWPLLFVQMRSTILCTDASDGFITSDCPFVMVDPQAHRLPPSCRFPAPGNPRIEITLPLTPKHCLLLSHNYPEGYMDISQAVVDEVNCRTRYQCTNQFVSQMGGTKQCWFDEGELPKDCWENSPEGIRAEIQRKRWLESKAKWEEYGRLHHEEEARPEQS